MDGLLFLGTIIAIGLVMHWVVLNDRAGPRGATRGLFAMRNAVGKVRRRKDSPPQDDTARSARRRNPGARDWLRR